MRLYLMRHCQPESGERMDPTRQLTPTGERQAALMAEFLKRQIGRVDFVLSSMFARSLQTAKIMAPALGCASVIDTCTLDPDGDAEKAWQEIKFITGNEDETEVLIVTHHPLIDALIELRTGGKTGSGDQTHMHHGAICHTHSGLLCWIVRPDLIARDEDEAAMIEAATELCSTLETWHTHNRHVVAKAAKKAKQRVNKQAKRIAHGKMRQVFADKGKEALTTGNRPEQSGAASSGDGAALLDEAKGEYYYEEEPYKRWVLGDGGASGNCDLCEENAAEGWIPEDAVYPNADEPPQHPFCTCSEETKMKRVRYSYFDDEEEE